MRVYEALVPPRAEGMRLDKYAAQAFPLLPASVLRDAFARRDVKADGKRMNREAAVQAGQTIQLYTNYVSELPVVFEDEHILLLNKPAGISCDDDAWGGMTVLSLAKARAAGAYVPRLCHRLDHPTSGLLLLCKDDESEVLLFDAFKNRTLDKIYQCLVRGEMRPPAAVREAYLVKDAEKALVRIVTHETPGALPIATRYETLAFDGEISRLRVTLLTGRTHQIRAHMAFLSHPILGDDKYGDRAFNKRYKTTSLRLCATELTLHIGGCLSDLDGRTFRIEPPF
jgi:23S rRNA pseudouridine955/2504/2580 synthase